MINNIRENNPELRRESMKLRLKKFSYKYKSVSIGHEKRSSKEDFFDFANVIKNFNKTHVTMKQESHKSNKYDYYKKKPDEDRSENIKSDGKLKNSAKSNEKKDKKIFINTTQISNINLNNFNNDDIKRNDITSDIEKRYFEEKIKAKKGEQKLAMKDQIDSINNKNTNKKNSHALTAGRKSFVTPSTEYRSESSFNEDKNSMSYKCSIKNADDKNKHKKKKKNSILCFFTMCFS